MANNINGGLPVPSAESPEFISASDSSKRGSYADALQKKSVPASSVNDMGGKTHNANTSDNHSPILKSEDQTIQDCSLSATSDSRPISGCYETVEDLSPEPDTSVNSIQDAIYSEDSAAASDDQGTFANLPSSTEIPAHTDNQDDHNSSELSDESPDEDNERNSDADAYPSAMKWQMRKRNPDLPKTVTVLDAPGGGKVYLVGTAHFSFESQEDVAQTIRATQPDVVTVELCKGRVGILSLDEAAIAEETQNMNLEKMLHLIRKNGTMQGILYLLLLRVSAHITKQLGMAPGGEFRVAFLEARKIPGCMVQLADRPIHITLQRVLAMLSLWQKLKIGWYLLNCRDPISKQDVERCKQMDLMEEMLAQMMGEYPEVSKIFVNERDTYLTYSLQMAATPLPSHVSPSGIIPMVVVGVVGVGHVPGILSKWGKVKEEDIAPLNRIPKPSLSSRIVRKAIKYSFYGLLLYGCYRILPKAVTRRPVGIIEKFLRR